MDNRLLIEQYNALKTDARRCNFLDQFTEGPLDLELAHFFLGIAQDAKQDDEVRIAALKIIGLYHGDYEHAPILDVLSRIALDEDEDEYVRNYAFGALEFSPVTDKEINMALAFVQGDDEDDNLRAAAFDVIHRNKKHVAAITALKALLDNKDYAKVAQMALDDSALG